MTIPLNSKKQQCKNGTDSLAHEVRFFDFNNFSIYGITAIQRIVKQKLCEM